MDFEHSRGRQFQLGATYVAESAPLPLIQDINADIAASIDIVRRIRLEVMRLDNDIKSSQLALGYKRSEDTQSRAEIESLIAAWRSEKETLLREVTRLKELLATVERSSSSTEGYLQELRQKGAEINKKTIEIDSEIEVARKKKSKIVDQMSEFQRKIDIVSEKNKQLASFEERIDGFNKKQVVEAETAARLQKDLMLLQKSHQSLADESTEISVRLQQKREQSTEVLTKKSSAPAVDPSQEALQAELRKDLFLFENLQMQMKATTEAVQAIDTSSYSTTVTKTTSVTSTVTDSKSRKFV